MVIQEHARSTARLVALSHLNTPYMWGGDDPVAGFDCSGLCIEILKSVGLLPRAGDWTAHGLYEKLLKYGAPMVQVEAMHEGCLVFWHGSNDARIVHVEYALDRQYTIGASGGGSANVDLAAAIKANAYVKIRPVRRTRLHNLLDPFAELPEGKRHTD